MGAGEEESMKIGLLQTKQNELYDFENRTRIWQEEEILKYQNEMLEKNLALASKAAKDGADVIVTTEAINFAGRPQQYTGDYKSLIRKSQDRVLETFSETAKKQKAYLILGMYYVDNHDALFNCAMLLDMHGNVKECYKKTHLAGEEKEYITAGNRLPVIDTEYGKFGMAVCWDMQFPETARILALGGADIIFCPTWGWESVYGPARAYENGIYTAAAMAVPYWMDIEGIRSPSQLVAPDGRILACGNHTTDETVIAEADVKDAKEYRTARLEQRQTRLYEKCGLK